METSKLREDPLTPSSKPANPMAQVLTRRDFRLLWLGQATSLLGDQFAMIATPWLVLALTNDPLVFVVMLVLSTANGYFTITVMTLLQSLTPRAMLGRLMSLLLFASMGLLPLSLAICGAVSRWSLNALFIGSGVLMMFVAVWAAFQPAFHSPNPLQAESQITANFEKETMP